MRDASDRPLIGCVLLAIAAVLAAPVAGRAGHLLAANLLVVLAAGAGVAAFALAAARSLAASRAADRPRRGERRW